MSEIITTNTAKVMGTIDQKKLSGNDKFTDANVSDAIRTISSITGVNIAQNKVFSVAYSIARKFGLTSKFKFFNLGVSDEIFNQVPEVYRIKLINKSNNAKYVCTINAVLQETINFKTSSSWTPIIPEFLSSAANVVSQFIPGFSLASSIASRRIWTGTEPLDLTIKFKFEAYKNAEIEVVVPCLVLQQLALPARSGTGAAELFLIPPGPSPFGPETEKVINAIKTTYNYYTGKVAEISTSIGEHTKISLGTFITFQDVIVTAVEVNFDKRMDTNGFPVGADAKVTFQTYEIMTKEKLEESYITKIGKDSLGTVPNISERTGELTAGI